MSSLQSRPTGSTFPAMPYNAALNPASAGVASSRITSSRPAIAVPPPSQPRLFARVTWWADRRRLSLRQLRQELIDAPAATPEAVMARLSMLDRIDADLAVAEQAWHPNAGPDVAWPMGILKARYRGIENLLQPR